MGVLLLIVTTFIWGTAFLAQKFGADHLGPVAFTVLRNVLGGSFLLLVILFRNLKTRPQSKNRKIEKSINSSILAGACCGVPLFFAMTSQQVGVEYTTPGVCAFLTTNYVLFVPLIAAFVSRRLPRLYIISGAALALVGTYFICMTGEGEAAESFAGIGKGEAWSLLCAFLFALQMLSVDHFARKVDLLVMSASQLFACALVGLPFMFALSSETAKLSFDAVTAAALPLVYCGVFSSGIAYTLQNVAQSRASASVAAIVLSMESVFGALSGWLVLGDTLSVGQFFGCSLVLFAVIATQLFSCRDR